MKRILNGSEKILKPDIYNQSKYILYDGLPFVSCISDFKFIASQNH